MAVNKVEINRETVLDLTQDSVTPKTLKKGVTAHNAAGEKITGEAVDDIISLGISGASVGQAALVKSVDDTGKPTEWEPATLAKADGSNIPSNSGVMNTWRERIAALPGVKVYGKADSSGKIMAYTDKACPEEINYLLAMELSDYGNLLLIYDHKTYQCVGFEKAASMQETKYYSVAVLFRSEIVTDSSGAAVLKVETARLNVIDYISGEINAPITITAGELPLTTITTT